MPSYLVKVSEEHAATDQLTVTVVNHNQRFDSIIDTGAYYGDGSGSPFSACPRIRRCASAVTKVSETNSVDSSCSFNLPGKVQTTARAEILPRVFLFERAAEGSSVEYVTDHLPLMTKFNRGKLSCLNSINADLYLRILHNIDREKT